MDRAWIVHWTVDYNHPTDDPCPYLSGVMIVIGDYTEEEAIGECEEELARERPDYRIVTIQATFWDDLLETVEAQLLDEVG
jgi:hypothetical protein